MALLLAELAMEPLASPPLQPWHLWVGENRSRDFDHLLRRGWIETEGKNSALERVVRITESGRLAAMGGRDLEREWSRSWDGLWRLVVFDVPEARRSLRLKLRRALRALRFGCLQNSVWLSPDPVDQIKSVIRGATIDVEALTLMEARPCGGESHADYVAGGWDFSEINRRFEAHMRILDRVPPLSAPPSRKRGWFESEWKAWNYAINVDPLLPRVLLPKDYRGCEAWRRRQAVLKQIVASA